MSCTFLKQSLISDYFLCARKGDLEILISNVHHLLYERCHRERSELTQILLSWEVILFPWTSGLVTVGKAILNFALSLISLLEAGDTFFFLFLLHYIPYIGQMPHLPHLTLDSVEISTLT